MNRSRKNFMAKTTGLERSKKQQEFSHFYVMQNHRKPCCLLCCIEPITAVNAHLGRSEVERYCTLRTSGVTIVRYTWASRYGQIRTVKFSFLSKSTWIFCWQPRTQFVILRKAVLPKWVFNKLCRSAPHQQLTASRVLQESFARTIKVKKRQLKMNVKNWIWE